MLEVKAPLELLAELQTTGEAVPKGWYLATYYAEKWNLSTAQTGRYLRQALKEGKMERKNFRIYSGDKIMPIPHYKIK